MSKKKAVVQWLLRAARWVENPYEQAEILYQALGDGKPYPWGRIQKHFKAFNDSGM